MVIEKQESKWILYSKDKSKVLGTFSTKKDALKRERQINYFKHLKGKKQPLQMQHGNRKTL